MSISASERIRRRAVIMAATCTFGLTAVYLTAVWTVPGQRFEDAVLRAADRVAGSAERARALDILDPISVPLVVAVAILTMLICVLRRRMLVGLLTNGMIVAAVATTEAFQHFGQRPVLLQHGYRRDDQSFPSGHTTVAMVLMCAVVMVVPYRVRSLAVFLTWLWAASVGVATVTASWHRPSDTVGSGLIVAGWAATTVAVLALCDKVRQATLPTPVERGLQEFLRWAYGALAVLAFAVAMVVVAVVLKRSGPAQSGTEILLAGRCLALSASAAVAAFVLTLLRRVDLGAPGVDQAGEGNPHVRVGSAGVDRPAGS
jgi:membrane-associated phospholipid phosphatase